MADQSNSSSPGRVPPKLDLRKRGVLKDKAHPVEATAPIDAAATTAPIDMDDMSISKTGVIEGGKTRPIGGVEAVSGDNRKKTREVSADPSKTMPLDDDDLASVGDGDKGKRTGAIGATQTRPIEIVEPVAADNRKKTGNQAKAASQTRPIEIAERPAPADASKDASIDPSRTMPIDLSELDRQTGPIDDVVQTGPISEAPTVIETDKGDSQTQSISSSETLPIDVSELGEEAHTQDLTSQTIHIKIPGAQGDAKRETSRIPLSAAMPTAPVPGAAPKPAAPKTIRIKPAPAGGAAIDTSQAEKRKTSRISLESALGTGAEGEGAPPPARPQTIRLKRPGEPATVKAVPAPEASKDGSALSKTSRLDESTEEAEATPTRRKTIKVKRPTARTAVKTLAVARPEGAAKAAPQAAPILGAPAGMSAPSGEPNVAFSIISIAALLVTCFCIYMFASQVFGPNSSGTKLSYALPEMNLSFPGKLQRAN